jgi:hypothetical protein
MRCAQRAAHRLLQLCFLHAELLARARQLGALVAQRFAEVAWPAHSW